MMIGEIGKNFKSTWEVRYLSDESLLEYDAIIINFDSILKNYDLHQAAQYLRRKKNFKEFIMHKKIPLIFFTPTTPDSFQMVVNTTMTQVSFDFFAPVPPLKIENEIGTLVTVIAKTPFSDFLTKYKGHFSYKSYLITSVGSKIIETQHTKKSLGFYDENCIFIPELKFSSDFNEIEFLSDLVNCAKNSLKSTLKPDLPDWAHKFLLPKEMDLKLSIKNLNGEIARLQNELEGKELEYLNYINTKRLFTGTGTELEDEVRTIFKQLGFEILESEPDRDDLIMKYSNKVIVVEIKGVNKSAAESHAAQLEKWSMNYFLKYDIQPKPLLIVNAWKDTQIDQRNEMSFPDQMTNFSVHRGHCLLTTIQLLGMYYKFIEDPSSKDLIIESLFNTVGRFRNFDDWKTFISVQP